MRWRYCPPVAIALVFLFLFQTSEGLLYSQTAPPTPQELDQLLAPIALYPDALVAQITAASTNPQEIIDVNNWMQQNGNLSGDALVNAAQQQGFDPAFIALLSFPQVLNTMAQNIDDYAAIGQAFSTNQGEVTDSIQRLRAQAYASGSLRSSSELQVVQQPQGNQQIIVIQPANPQVVYVPQYDPSIIYGGPPGGVVGGLITFGAGIAIGAALANSHPWGWGGWGWNWGRRSVIVNHNVWVVNNRYRPRRVTYRPRPPRYPSKPGYGGSWGRPGNRPGGNRPPVTSRPPNRPYPGNGNAGNRPYPNNRPSPNSGNANRPSTRPAPVSRPATPNPATRPAPTTRPAPAARPAPTPRPTPTARPATPNRNPYAGFPQANKAAPARPPSGARPSAFGGGGSNGRSAQAAGARGRQSAGGAPKKR